jgi:hypothetical protein
MLARAGIALAPNRIARAAKATNRATHRAILIVVPPLDLERKRGHHSSGKDFNSGISRFVQRGELALAASTDCVLNEMVMTLRGLMGSLAAPLDLVPYQGIGGQGRPLAKTGMALAPNRMARAAKATNRATHRAVFIVVPRLDLEQKRAHDSSREDSDSDIS